MSKLGCPCGHTIPDQTDFLPYKARFIADQDWDHTPEQQFARAVTEYLEARAQGAEQEHAFLVRYYATHYEVSEEQAATWVASDVSKSSALDTMIERLISPFWGDFQRYIYECEVCGRLLVEAEMNHFSSYMPEQERRGILAARDHHFTRGSHQRNDG